jgi:hypothetical protein
VVLYRIHELVAERFYSGRDSQVMVREGQQSGLLDPRLDLKPDDPPQFEWGDDAVGIRLAVALLADAMDDDRMAINLAWAFSARVVVMLPKRWTMSRARVLSFVSLNAWRRSRRDCHRLRNCPAAVAVPNVIRQCGDDI